MANHFARYVANLRQSLFDEQILNGNFLQVEICADATPGLLEQVCVSYFRQVVKIINIMVPLLQGPPYNSRAINVYLTHFRGKASVFGAARVTQQIDCMSNNVKDGNFEACKIAFEGIKRESEVLQLKLENYFKVKKQSPPTEIEDQPEHGDMDSDND